MVASCDNRESLYTSLCNTRDSKNDISVKADKFVNKSKYCALCHGFVSYSQITLELAHCSTSVIVAGKRSIEMTVSDDTCTLDVYEDSRFGYIKENVINVDEMNCFLVNINICFTSYFTFISQQFVSPNISKFTVGLIILKPSPYSKLHFRLIISFDEHVTEVASRIKETPSVLVINILILSTVSVKIRYTLHVGIIP